MQYTCVLTVTAIENVTECLSTTRNEDIIEAAKTFLIELGVVCQLKFYICLLLSGQPEICHSDLPRPTISIRWSTWSHSTRSKKGRASNQSLDRMIFAFHI